MSGFKKATRETVKARIAVQGPTGSGKTYSALGIATGLAAGGKVAVIDTEKGSASTYANRFDFDVLELGPPFDPDRYVAAIEEASRAGYAVVVVDSLSHAWFDEGGVLDIVDKASARTGNKFAAWASGTPKQNALINAVVRCPVHIIATIRSKMEYAQEKDDKGRSVVRKLGLGPVQRDNVEYEFAIVGEIALDHSITFTKSRFEALQDRSFNKPGADLGRIILAELQGDPEVGGLGGKPEGSNVTTRPAASSTTTGGEARSRATTTAAPSVAPRHADPDIKQEREKAKAKPKDGRQVAEQILKVQPSLATWDAWLEQNVKMGMVEELTATKLRIALDYKELHESDVTLAKEYILSDKKPDKNQAAVNAIARLQQIANDRKTVNSGADLKEAVTQKNRAVRKYPKMTGRYGY